LRALGGTRWQVAWLIGREAVLMGALGAALGMALGVPFARWLIRGMERFYHTSMPEIHLTWVPFALAAGVGIGVAVLGALAPVVRSWRITPREGIQGIAQDRSTALARILPWFALVLFAGAG